MISVVCVYNNERLLADYLLDGLKCQADPYELIIIDNTKNKFKSAAEALNYGARTARGEYIIFAHQDVRLGGNMWLHDAKKMLDSLPSLGAAGIAGKRGGAGTLTNATHGTPAKAAGAAVKEAVVVQTVDESLIIVPGRVFDVLKFDEITCDGWHLYAVEYCLSSRLRGLNTYVLPLPAHHASTGSTSTPTQQFDRLVSHLPMIVPAFVPKGYYETLNKVMKKHKKSTPKIHTVIRDWSTRYPIILQQMVNLARQALNLARHAANNVLKA